MRFASKNCSYVKESYATGGIKVYIGGVQDWKMKRFGALRFVVHHNYVGMDKRIEVEQHSRSIIYLPGNIVQ